MTTERTPKISATRQHVGALSDGMWERWRGGVAVRLMIELKPSMSPIRSAV